ncbi:unnamed protein product [Ceutorhynchus assimilis]|uniref:Lysine-specific demethylase 5A n=1 Tax=Ceutorhynchus assimilis TaxID=467358 RepID=A0A9N9MF55_9CUCU|nr:unnamed protein product [Ceutorhynchus assimilis]
MLLCDGCDDSYHPYCLIQSSATIISKGDWMCPNCVAEEVSKPMVAFGFEQAEREYTLQQFGDMADSFKSDYFDMPGHMVPTSTVEREFWRIVSTIDEDVMVEYGADLHTMDHGSGFPTKLSSNLLQGDKEYAESSWNLNNLPVLDGSVLGYINADVSGMKVPWMYVGMCFATFCWHNEDHWAYSINYLHWGEPKTWYGVPGSEAEKFEETMKSVAPELFHSQPDLLHQLVTIMNPNILMNVGVPVYRTDQHAGEFVVTFPRAYHAGFNQGYNFAEAVNFAPANWLRMGRECMLHYSHLKRFCVFSHDELVCKMALDNDKLDSAVAAETYQDMLVMMDTEKKLRKTLLDWGVKNAEREAFELLPDDERQCEVCKTTCFLSAVTCSCISNTLVCLRHCKDLCECPSANRTLRYRYTLEELSIMLKALKVKAESFDHWLAKVKDILDQNSSKTFNLSDLKTLLDEADENKIPNCELLEKLTSALIDVEKCASFIQQLESHRHSDKGKYKLPVELLTLFGDENNSLVSVFDEAKNIRDLLTQTEIFTAKSEELLSQSLQQNSLVELKECQNHGDGLGIDLPNLQLINTRIKQVQFMKEVDAYRRKSNMMEVALIETLIQQGNSVPPHVEIEKELSNLQSVVHKSHEWEQRAQEFLMCQDPDIFSQGAKLLKDASNIPCHLPTASIVSEAIKNGREWLEQLEEINKAEYYPYYSAIEELIRKGRLLVIHLEEFDRLNEFLILADGWKEETGRVFLKKNSLTTLIDTLAPRTDSPKQGKCTIDFTHNMDPATVQALFKKAEQSEMSIIRNLRQFNQQKSLEPNDLSFNYCVCGRGVSGVMMRCVLCLDWFHSTCTHLPKIASTKFNSNVHNIALSLAFEDCKYICCNCQRSKRPKLNKILSLLLSLQKLHVRVPEGEALQGLTERAMNWQDRAKQLLLTPELVRAKIKLNNLLQKFDAIQKTKIFTTEIKEVFKNNAVHGEGLAYDSRINESDDASKESTRNQVKDCVVRITPEVRRRMEELLMEGDLLEVSLDETEALWKLFLSSRDHKREVMLIDFDDPLKASPKKRGRKRLSKDSINPAKKTTKTTKANREKKGCNKQIPNEEEVCAAYYCQKPSGEIVDWVECDAGCAQWFHMACVGLSIEEINEDEDSFICMPCSQSTTSRSVKTCSPRSPDLTQPSTSKDVS